MRKVGITTLAQSQQSKKTLEVSLQVMCLLLINLLFFSMTQGKVDLTAFTVALMMTYIMLHYWQRRIQKAKEVSNNIPFKKDKNTGSH